MIKTYSQVLFIFLLGILLTGCFSFTNGNNGGLVVNEQRSLKAINADQVTHHTANMMIVKDPAFKNSNIDIISFNHDILLIGETPHASLRVKAEKLVSALPGVQRIYNEITISSPSSLITRSSDTWITAKVRANMLTAPGLKSGQIKVASENGVVYLMGHVTRSQADSAVEVARRVAGVQRVVKVFRYRD